LPTGWHRNERVTDRPGLAVIAEDYGAPDSFRLRPFDPGRPGPGEVRVRVRAAGLSFVDVLTAAGKYQTRPPLPFIPGSEICGEVEDVGDGVPRTLIGKRVLGASAKGALAHAVNVDRSRIWPMPTAMSDTVGAAFRVGFVTAYEGLIRLGGVGREQTVVVLGAGGGVGLAAVQLASVMGARVIASASTEEKRRLARENGAVAAVDSAAADWRDQVKAAARGHPVAIVFDPVGGAMTEAAFRSLGWGGRHLMVGFASGEIPRIPANLAIVKGISLIGVNVGRLLAEQPDAYAANLSAMFDLFESRELAPVIARRYRLEDFVQAMEAAGSGTLPGRVVVTL
jgi:NADPH2:quinone reductase